MFKNLKISKKLLLAFVVAAMISSISGVLGIVMVKKTNADYSHALENYGFAQGNIGRLGMVLNANRANVRDIVFLSDPALLDAAYKSVQMDVAKTTQLLEDVRPTNTSDAAKALFAEIEKGIESYRTARAKVMDLGMALKDEEAYDAWTNEAKPIIDKIVSEVDELMRMNSEAGTKVSHALSASGEFAILIMIGTLLCGLALALALAIVISRSISKPIIQIEQAAKKMSDGNYDVDIAFESRNEIGSLADSMRKMVDNTKSVINDTSRILSQIALNNLDVSVEAKYIGVFAKIEQSINHIVRELTDTMGKIKIASEQVSSGSEQVSSASVALAQGATEQASSVEQLSAAISEISKNVEQNAKNALNAKDMAGGATMAISSSNTQMQKLMVAMEEINAKSSQISKIIKTIEDIAFQTNILALNAAVEAARAGQAGKGFAVVADEVRSLASKSADAAKNTTTLIESSVNSIAAGVKLASQTADELLNVVENATKTTAIIGEISKATGEQAVALAQVSQGIGQISSVVQTNSATSEESAAASEELSSQASMMKQQIAKFKLKDGNNYVESAGKPTQISLENTAEKKVPQSKQNLLSSKY